MTDRRTVAAGQVVARYIELRDHMVMPTTDDEWELRDECINVLQALGVDRLFVSDLLDHHWSMESSVAR